MPLCTVSSPRSREPRVCLHFKKEMDVAVKADPLNKTNFVI